jgi:hypothetical protein
VEACPWCESARFIAGPAPACRAIG